MLPSHIPILPEILLTGFQLKVAVYGSRLVTFKTRVSLDGVPGGVRNDTSALSVNPNSLWDCILYVYTVNGFSPVSL